MWNVTIIMFSFFWFLISCLCGCVYVFFRDFFCIVRNGDFWLKSIHLKFRILVNNHGKDDHNQDNHNKDNHNIKNHNKNDQNIDNHNKTIMMKTIKIKTIFIIFLISCIFWYWCNYPTVLEVSHILKLELTP